MVAHRSGLFKAMDLGDQFAYDERQIGDDGYYGNHGESLGIGGYSRNEGEQRFYVISDGGTTIGTGYDTDKSNTDLDGGEEFFGFFQLFQYSFGSFVPFFRQEFQGVLYLRRLKRFHTWQKCRSE